MIFDQNENTTTVTQEKASIVELVKKLDASYADFENNNVIINLTSLSKITLEELLEFLQISNKHREANHSFIIVSNKVDLDDIPDEIVLVPTLQEAHDIIEMEEMERDLGF